MRYILVVVLFSCKSEENSDFLTGTSRHLEVRGISSSECNAIADEIEDFFLQDSIRDAKDEFTVQYFNNSVITGHDPVTYLREINFFLLFISDSRVKLFCICFLL